MAKTIGNEAKKKFSARRRLSRFKNNCLCYFDNRLRHKNNRNDTKKIGNEAKKIFSGLKKIVSGSKQIGFVIMTIVFDTKQSSKRQRRLSKPKTNSFVD